MRLTFQAVFNTLIFVLLAVVLGAMWCEAQTTNAPAATNGMLTNAAASADLTNEEFFQSFNLDHVKPLRTPLFGNPVWK